MTRRRWIRNRPGTEEDRAAAGIAFGVGAAVGLVVFYFVRIFLARDELEPARGSGRGLEPASRKGAVD